MRVLVTGANGFVGRALLDLLGSDNRFAASGSMRHEAGKTSTNSFETVVRNLEPDSDWRDALEGVDAVVHTAARVHVMKEAKADALALYRRVNAEGTENLARQAAAAGVSRFVFVSSIKVNGQQTLLNRPYSAADNPAPVDPYGVSKLEAEIALRQAAESTGMEVVIVRPTLVYGPGVKANFLTMMKWLYSGVPLPFAGIDNMRSMIALDSLIDLLVHCLLRPAAANRVFLASDGEDLSTTELLVSVGDALSRPARLFRVPRRMLYAAGRLAGKEALVRRLTESLQVDISKTRDVLGWRSKISVSDALKKTADAFIKSRQ